MSLTALVVGVLIWISLPATWIVALVLYLDSWLLFVPWNILKAVIAVIGLAVLLHHWFLKKYIYTYTLFIESQNNLHCLSWMVVKTSSCSSFPLVFLIRASSLIHTLSFLDLFNGLQDFQLLSCHGMFFCNIVVLLLLPWFDVKFRVMRCFSAIIAFVHRFSLVLLHFAIVYSVSSLILWLLWFICIFLQPSCVLHIVAPAPV